MKVIQINSVCGIRSTGRICADLVSILAEDQDDSIVAYGREEVPTKWHEVSYKICNKTDIYIHALKSRLLDSAGFGCVKATKKLIEFIKEQNPDVIHLHNLHGYYVDIRVLFEYLRTIEKPIIWSLYDCWSFTGHCAHFDYNNCFQWQTGCIKCKYQWEYPRSILLSCSKSNYKKKKQLFTDIPNMHLIAPSKWMKSVVLDSFMKEYPIHVFPNGIDLEVFRPTEGNFRKLYNLEDKFIVLGVASFWNDLKGIQYFCDLASMLPTEVFRIVLVGNIDKKRIKLPENVLWIANTNNTDELCEIYSVADVFVNPTLQETQGLTTIEALACGTPAIVFNSGGAAECIDDTCGVVIKKADLKGLYKAILHVAEKKIVFDRNACLKKAREYDKNLRYKPFLELYKELT